MNNFQLKWIQLGVFIKPKSENYFTSSQTKTLQFLSDPGPIIIYQWSIMFGHARDMLHTYDRYNLLVHNTRLSPGIGNFAKL